MGTPLSTDYSGEESSRSPPIGVCRSVSVSEINMFLGIYFGYRYYLNIMIVLAKSVRIGIRNKYVLSIYFGYRYYLNIMIVLAKSVLIVPLSVHGEGKRTMVHG